MCECVKMKEGREEEGELHMLGKLGEKEEDCGGVGRIEEILKQERTKENLKVICQMVLAGADDTVEALQDRQRENVLFFHIGFFFSVIVILLGTTIVACPNTMYII